MHSHLTVKLYLKYKSSLFTNKYQLLIVILRESILCMKPDSELVCYVNNNVGKVHSDVEDFPTCVSDSDGRSK